MEFLLTYGWAILVVITAISALAYFGVLDPGKYFATNYCRIDMGLSCLDHTVTYKPANPDEGDLYDINEFTLVVRNNRGDDFHVTNVKIDDEYGASHAPLGDGIALPNHEDAPVTVPNIRNNNPAIKSGDRYEIEFIITVTNDVSGLSHYYRGYARGKVE